MDDAFLRLIESWRKRLALTKELEGPLDLGAIEPETLGHLYERSLAKRGPRPASGATTKGGTPEPRKTGGVYYTPRYVVDYIVRSTLGPMLHGKAPRDLRSLRVLDLACGAGAFLLGAYRYLLDWHIAWYKGHLAPSQRPDIDALPLERGPDGSYHLSAAERRRILLTHIYGVDIDPQAVEVARLSLLLAMLEGESAPALATEPPCSHEAALAALEGHIVCGNSVLGPELGAGPTPRAWGDDARCPIDTFDWSRMFPEVFADGGFDAVLGNPPYRRERDYQKEMDAIAKTPFGRRYRSPRMDLWYYFAHRGVEVLKDGGHLSFIVNSYWASGAGAEKLVAELRHHCHLEEIFSLGKLRIFPGVSGRHMIFRLRKGRPSDGITSIKVARGQAATAEPFVVGHRDVDTYPKRHDDIFHDGKVDIERPTSGLHLEQAGIPLDRLAILRQGIAENPAQINARTRDAFPELRLRAGEGVFALRPDELLRLNLPPRERSLLRPYFDLCDLGRLWIAEEPSLSLIYSTKETWPEEDMFPALRDHLTRFKPIMARRRETLHGANRWWHLHWPRDPALWSAPKIVSLQMGARPSFVPVSGDVYTSFSTNVIVLHPTTREHLFYIAGLLSSGPMWDWYKHHAKRRGSNLEINVNVLARSPIRPINFHVAADRQRHDHIVAMVGRMLELTRMARRAHLPQERSAIDLEMSAIDAAIDATIRDLYGIPAR